MKVFKVGLGLFLVLVLHSQAANAALILTIERISDTEGRLIASGEVDVDAPSNIGRLAFSFIKSGSNSPINILSNNLTLGDDKLVGMRFRNPFQAVIAMEGPWSVGDLFNGELHFSIESGVLLDLGTRVSLINNERPFETMGFVDYVAPAHDAVNSPQVFGLFGMSICLLLLARTLRRV